MVEILYSVQEMKSSIPHVSNMLWAILQPNPHNQDCVQSHKENGEVSKQNFKEKEDLNGG